MRLKVALLYMGLFVCSVVSFAQPSYKQLMLDPSVNFYDVCAVAEAYFATIDKDAKGSGWKGYQRWKYENESKYYPTGDRSMEDPYYVRKAYEEFILENPRERVLYSGGWEEIGPGTIDSITGHYAAGLGRLETFYVDPTDEDVMYIGSRSGGFWKSENGGATWTGGSTDFLFASGVNCIAVSPTNNDSILINVRNSGNGTTHGVYRSTDAGETWVETNFNPIILGKGGLGSSFAINEIKYHPTIPNLIFIAASDGLYRSDDNLATWLKVTNGSISEIDFHPTDPSIIYIYDYYYWGPNKNKVLRSTDFGLNFLGSVDIAGNADNTNVHLDVSPICENCLYFASGNGLWKSFDSGVTFNFVNNPGISSEGFAISDTDTTKLTFGGIDGFASADGGLSFSQTTWWSLGSAEHGPGGYMERYANSDHYIHADIRNTNCINGVFYMATDGLFARSYDNGVTWEHLNHDMSIRENYTLGVSQSNQYRTIVGSQDNGTSIKDKESWIEFWGADGMEGIIQPLNSDWMIGSNQYGGRRRTYNAGQTQGGASPPGHSSGWVAPMAYDPNNQMTVYHFGELVHKSTDFGSTWVDLGTPSFSGTIDQAAIAENNSNIIIVSRGQDIERSIDGGLTFVDIQGTLPAYSITDIAFDPRHDSTIIVTYNRYQNDGQKVYITHDLGNTWTNITTNLNKMPIRGVVIDHSPARTIYLAAEIGVYVKAMDDLMWTLYNDDLPNCSVYELEVMYGSNSIRAATWGRGVWEYTLKDRVTYPAILTTVITDQPTYVTPKESVDQFVTSKIHYDGDITVAYVKWSADAPTFENSIDMENVSDTTWTTELPLPNYPEGTKMYFKVFAVGDAEDTTETYKFMYTVQPYEYCAGAGSGGTGSDYIDFVELETISNTSAQDYYGDFTDQFTTLYLDSTYTLQANLNYSFALDAMGAWIDYNDNSEFEADEFIEMSDFDVAHQSFGVFTVPLSASVGDTVRMRVRNSYNAELNPCGIVAGEVEDYSIIISCANTTGELSAITCEPYLSPSGLHEWNVTGIYTDTLANSHGCDSIITVNLTVNSSFTTLNPESCEPYLSPSGLYTWASSGTYTDTLTNILGCDSVITVNLTILEDSESDITVLECDSYNSPSGEFTWTESGIYTDTLTNVLGCDSIITVDLTINSVDVSVSAALYSLTANASGVTYQWLDCNLGWAAIAGATEQTFTPFANGSYAVIITDGVCADTSDCFDIVALSFDVYQGNEVALYPNPTSGDVHLQFDQVVGQFQLTIYDASGRKIIANTYQNQGQVDLNLNTATGIYYIVLEGVKTESICLKLIIE